MITTGCHAPFELRDQVAARIGRPPSAVVVRPGPSGGSFGGLLDPVLPAPTGLAAWVLNSGVEFKLAPSAHRAFAAIHDVGVVIDCASAHAQVQGGFATSASTALGAGGLLAGSFDFLRSTAVPPVEVDFVADADDVRDAKGLGEPVAVGVSSAIFNAWHAGSGGPGALHSFQSWAE